MVYIELGPASGPQRFGLLAGPGQHIFLIVGVCHCRTGPFAVVAVPARRFASRALPVRRCGLRVFEIHNWPRCYQQGMRFETRAPVMRPAFNTSAPRGFQAACCGRTAAGIHGFIQYITPKRAWQSNTSFRIRRAFIPDPPMLYSGSAAL